MLSRTFPLSPDASFEMVFSELEVEFTNLKPELEVIVRDPSYDVEGFIVVWNTNTSKKGQLPGIAKGGTRITPEVSLNEIRMLASRMALKNAAAGLPIGGCKSGLVGDPDAPGFEQKYKRWIQLCKPFLYENGGPFGGFGWDIGARPEHASWAIDVLGSGRSFTGKARAQGGTDYDVEGIAGLGVSCAANSLFRWLEFEPAGHSYAVQGLGAMGAGVIRYFDEGSRNRLVAISDPRIDGAWFLENGFGDVIKKAIVEGDFAALKGLLANSGADQTHLDCIYDVQVDIFFPCAVHDVISVSNQERLRCAVICEGANNPLSSEARNLLHDRGVWIIPDFVANPGGIIAAYTELLNGAASSPLDTQDLIVRAKKLTEVIVSANVCEVLDRAKVARVTPEKAGLKIAYERVLGYKEFSIDDDGEFYRGTA